MNLLEIRDLSLRFGGVQALDHIGFDVRENEICALIGPNGAGKTSLFNCVSGLYRVQSGTIRFRGQELQGLAAHRRASIGIARTFQNATLVEGLTALENVMLGAFAWTRAGMLGTALRSRRSGVEEKLARERALELMAELELLEHASDRVSDLPYGILKRLDLARAVVGKPALLLLDEPASGLNSVEAHALAGHIQRLRKKLSIAVLLVEHQMSMVLALADEIVVMEFGRKIAQGVPDVVRSDPRVIEAYLGAAS